MEMEVIITYCAVTEKIKEKYNIQIVDKVWQEIYNVS